MIYPAAGFSLFPSPIDPQIDESRSQLAVNRARGSGQGNFFLVFPQSALFYQGSIIPHWVMTSPKRL